MGLNNAMSPMRRGSEVIALSGIAFCKTTSGSYSLPRPVRVIFRHGSAVACTWERRNGRVVWRAKENY